MAVILDIPLPLPDFNVIWSTTNSFILAKLLQIKVGARVSRGTKSMSPLHVSMHVFICRWLSLTHLQLFLTRIWYTTLMDKSSGSVGIAGQSHRPVNRSCCLHIMSIASHEVTLAVALKFGTKTSSEFLPVNCNSSLSFFTWRGYHMHQKRPAFAIYGLGLFKAEVG